MHAGLLQAARPKNIAAFIGAPLQFHNGRDLLARVDVGARYSLIIALASTVLSVVIGTFFLVFVVAAAPNSAARKLTNFPGPDEGQPAWSADSKLIAYIHGSEPKYEEYNQRRLAVVPAATGSAADGIPAGGERRDDDHLRHVCDERA